MFDFMSLLMMEYVMIHINNDIKNHTGNPTPQSIGLMPPINATLRYSKVLWFTPQMLYIVAVVIINIVVVRYGISNWREMCLIFFNMGIFLKKYPLTIKNKGMCQA